jgi:hypothetical protein
MLELDSGFEEESFCGVHASERSFARRKVETVMIIAHHQDW